LSAVKDRLYSAAITIVTCTRNASATAVITPAATNLPQVSANAAGIATAATTPVASSTPKGRSPIQGSTFHTSSRSKVATIPNRVVTASSPTSTVRQYSRPEVHMVPIVTADHISQARILPVP